jgi:hypothetical protein
MKNALAAFLGLSFLFNSVVEAQTKADFESFSLSENSYWNGSDGSGQFNSGDFVFWNSYDQMYGSWSGFAYSNQQDRTTAGYANQYSVFTGSGYQSETFALASVYGDVGLKLASEEASVLTGFFVANTTYAALSMKEGDFFGKKFGGITGDDADWFMLTIKGYTDGNEVSTEVEVYLADFRFVDNAQDYILDHWRWVDLRPLGEVDSLSFFLSSSDEGMYGMNTPAYFAMDELNKAYYAPSAELLGTDAIHKDDVRFEGWATNCIVERGPQQMDNLSLGLATVGEEVNGTDKAGVNSIVSLGDGGSATLTFESPIYNGDGPDFAVFENGFSASFLELAFVEVSSDGLRFVRFPAVSRTSTETQIGSFGTLKAEMLYNLAGKYAANYGTPFDLEELADSADINVDAITHVRIIDVIGNTHPAYAQYDRDGNAVNDPWPTPFASSGFDLDAVGVLHSLFPTNNALSLDEKPLVLFPNPALGNATIQVQSEVPFSKVRLLDASGIEVYSANIESSNPNFSLPSLTSGYYIVETSSDSQSQHSVLLVY